MTKSGKTEVFREQSERIYLLCCWTVVSQRQIITFSDNLHTFLNSFSNGDVCYGLAYRPRLSGENSTENASFKNPLWRGDLWERRFVLVWMDENRGFFESDPVMVLVTSKCACSHERWYRFHSNDSKTQEMVVDFVLKTEKRNVRFQTKTDTCARVNDSFKE